MIYDYARCSSIHALYYKYVNMIICTYTYIISIVFMSENSLLANVYFTLYPTLNKILLTYISSVLQQQATGPFSCVSNWG